MNLTRGITTTTSVPRWCSEMVCKRGTSAPMNLGNKHLPDSTGRTAQNQFDSSALPKMRSHFHHKRNGLNRETEVHGGPEILNE
jgi:hypothetical protein